MKSGNILNLASKDPVRILLKYLYCADGVDDAYA